MAGDLLGESADVIAALSADVHDGDTRGGEHLADEGVALAAIGTIMGAIVEFDDQARGERGGVDQHEVDALGLDAPPMGFVAARPWFHLYQVGEANLSEDLVAGGRGLLERVEMIRDSAFVNKVCPILLRLTYSALLALPEPHKAQNAKCHLTDRPILIIM